tara:strand:- start:18806 stop:19234 length:429 start_codon:yes stop_codon:yes gene_type:complete
MQFEFTVPGEPVAKQRPKARMVRIGGGRMTVKMRTPKKTLDYEAKVAESCADIPRFEPGPIRVAVVFVFERPKRLMRKKDPQGRVWKTTRSDVDNCLKALLDGMAGLWSDDAVVCDVRAEKYYAAKGEKPHAAVMIEAINEG